MKVLIIQTAFIGDAILSTAAVASLSKLEEVKEIHLVVRYGNEKIFEGFSKVTKVWCWNKANRKNLNLLNILQKIRKENYTVAFTLQRFFSSGLLCAFSKAKFTYGFNKNPLSLFFTKKASHHISSKVQTHEIERNLNVLKLGFPNIQLEKPFLNLEKVSIPKELKITQKYICVAPASVWFTKQLPTEKWTELLLECNDELAIVFLGAAADGYLAEQIITSLPSRKNCKNYCGQLNLLQSALMMKMAEMNYVNDSAPLHLCSATDANVTAVFCSTVPAFGFTPLSSNSKIAQTEKSLSCRPCGLHGKKACPLKHFDCAKIDMKTYAI